MQIEGKVWRNKKWIDAPHKEAERGRVWTHRDLPTRCKEDNLKMSGIYALEVPSLKCVYIGQSINIQSRWSQWRHVLNRGKSEVKELQECWTNNKTLFEFKVVEITDVDMLIKEKAYAQKYVDDGYTLFNNYFHVNPKNVLISDEHIPLVTKMLRLITKGRLNVSELDRYLDTL